MRARPTCLLLATLLGGCSLENYIGGGDDDKPSDPDAGIPNPPDVPSPAIYTRGSLSPLFQLTPQAEESRFQIFGVTLADADFTVPGGGYVTVAQKLDEVGLQIGAERGGGSIDLIPTGDRIRAQEMPFRATPSDVAPLVVDGQRKIFVPLGGTISSPGNEVAVVHADGSVVRAKVGIRPLRVAVHPDGLVFVCNQYSNYISILDARTENPLVDAAGKPIEIATEFYCTDILLTDEQPGSLDHTQERIYVANSWRSSVLEYKLAITEDAAGRPTGVAITDPVGADPISTPAAELRGVGANPSRLTLSDDQRFLYVANIRGGEVARVALADGTVTAKIAINAPSADLVQIGDTVFVPTTMPDRGLLYRDEPHASPVLADPVVVTGLDGKPHEANPGAMFDGTRSYNFEDIRNGVLQYDFVLSTSSRLYYTDDVSAEPNFVAQQKILAGAMPVAVARNRVGDRIYVAMAGSDVVQELEVVAGTFRLRAVAGGSFATAHRPFAIAVDEDAGQLLVADAGGEVLETFDLATRQKVDTIDLGYANLATAAYPASNIETGEFLYYNAQWSNNGRKSCASCHFDELLVDGVGYSNGATSPTAYHQVRPNYNLQTTDNYFWNGSFKNGSYASLAFSAQTRTNCELIAFGLIEGPASDPATRVGDPNDRVTLPDRDPECRPQPSVDGLPANFDTIAAAIKAEKVVAGQVIQAQTGHSREEVSRLVDFYSVAQLRLPPNPLTYLHARKELDGATAKQIDEGKALFTSAGCSNCHDPSSARHPFSDGREHGLGADWNQRFVNRYLNDPRLVLPQPMLDALDDSSADPEINIHTNLDYFEPFCFSSSDCLVFEDPLAVIGNDTEETRRITLLDRINLSDPERGFVPGNVVGQPRINTPSLRGVWWQPNILHHGLAHTIGEAILAPGHPALRDGERGFAVNALGQIDVHGATSALSPEQVAALILFVETIE